MSLQSSPGSGYLLKPSQFDWIQVMKLFQFTFLPFAPFSFTIAPDQAGSCDDAIPKKHTLGISDLKLDSLVSDLHLHVERLDRYVHRNLPG